MQQGAGWIPQGARWIPQGALASGRVLQLRRIASCHFSRVPVRDFRDLVCWQLCRALKCEIWEFTAVGPAARDFKYRDQIRSCSAGPPANIAEGFGRWHASEFARFLEFARGSLQETINHLVDGHDRRYNDDPLYGRLMNLSRAALRTTTNLLRSKKRQAFSARSTNRRTR